MSKQSLIKGAAVLGTAGIIVKLLGAVFRIPLGNWIGDTGMANYGPAYYIYSFFLILATAGLPIAISKMVSESRAVGCYAQAHKVFKLSASLMLGIGILSFIILFTFAPQIANLIGNQEAALAMRAISPSLILVPIMAAYRGYFQGMQNMKPTAVSQVVEQFFRVVIGLAAAYILFNMGTGSFIADSFDRYERGAAGASFGATAGSIGGLLMILLIYALSRKSIKRKIATCTNDEVSSSKSILKKVLVIAVPITIGAAIMPIINLVDAGLVMNRLQNAAGFDYEMSKSLYGQLTGFVGSLINFPQVLTQAVAMSLVPVIAIAYKTRNEEQLHNNVALGLRMAVIIGFPCAFGLMSLAEPILLLLYPAQRESAMGAAPVLAIMAFGVLFLSTVQTLTGVLQGVSKQIIPVINLSIGVVCKIILTYTLTGIPSINIKGAAIGTVAAYMVAATLNIIAVKKYTGTHIDIGKTFIRPLISSAAMAVIVIGVYKVTFMAIASNSICTLISVAVGGLSYGVLIFVTKTISVDELAFVPKGDKLAKLVSKFVK
ncbi:MAG: polysaccharide biosynthesis protein [Anaerovoracaceae bacterium]